MGANRAGHMSELKILVLDTLLIFVLLSTSCGGIKENETPDRWKGSLGEFFSSVDLNDDGQIEPQEAAKYIDGVVEDQDLQCMQSNVDGADHGDTISEGELQRHLQSLLKVQHKQVLPSIFPIRILCCPSMIVAFLYRGIGWLNGSVTVLACRSM